MVPDEAVVLRINRLSQHLIMSGNVWGGCKLVFLVVSRPLFTDSFPRALSAGVPKCNEKQLCIPDKGLHVPRVS